MHKHNDAIEFDKEFDKRMDDIEKRLNAIDMSEYLNVFSVQFYTMSNCKHCEGRGHHHGIHCHRIKACKSCHGTGLVLKQD
jgi:DnaJ-class molecular chaperone